jgi:hypothetical protein
LRLFQRSKKAAAKQLAKQNFYMRKLLVVLLLANCLSTQAQLKPSGILVAIENARSKNVKEHSIVTARDNKSPIELTFQTNTCVGVSRENDQWYVLPMNQPSGKIVANTNLWMLPQDPFSKSSAYLIKLSGSDSTSATVENDRLRVTIYSTKFELHTAEARPHSDCFNNRYSLDIPGGDTLANALAGFYWGTMLQSVIEKTKAKNYPYSSGYVISTLNPRAYAGSYPDVDHEFQIKGRLAFSSDLDINVVRRMMELQFKLMQDDPEGLFRNPCAVQPSGVREYHVRRNSQNNKVNADMFLLTGNMEILEEAFHYFEATRDSNWLNRNIENLEKAAALTIANTDQYGRVWSDVYYEDQVMKDGRETMSGALAAYTFDLLAKMETILHREDKSSYYAGFSKKIAWQLVQPLPQGFWDDQHQRFVDWVDRNGDTHNHIHLLANILPVLFGYATNVQSNAVAKLVDSNLAEFQRFPSFISADVAAYNKYEIGDGGPYDLCAAGRYWWWDASYWKKNNNNDLLYKQLKTVATEAIKDSFYMGERYDMNHVYYIDNKDWHGADRYYEYPCVYTSVLIDNFLGIRHSLDADLAIKPNINQYGTIEFTNPMYNMRYTISAKGFRLKNLSDRPRRFAIDLSSIFKARQFTLVTGLKNEKTGSTATIILAPKEEAIWSFE